jgi:uridine phosphorylase
VTIHKSHIRKYWFGLDDVNAMADTVLLMERDRLEQYKAALDFTLGHFHGVFNGITGVLNGTKLSVIHSIGPAHIADCVCLLVEGFGIKRFISTGSIGGLSTEMGDIVISNECATQDGFSCTVYHDEVQYHGAFGYIVEIKMPELITISDAIRARIKEAFDCEIKSGPIFTVPAVSLEDEERLTQIKNRGYIALDLETGPFLGACRYKNAQGFCVHWVTDLPLERNFFYQYDGDPEIIEQDKDKKHKQWLNMPRLILPIVNDVIIPLFGN